MDTYAYMPHVSCELPINILMCFEISSIQKYKSNSYAMLSCVLVVLVKYVLHIHYVKYKMCQVVNQFVAKLAKFRHLDSIKYYSIRLYLRDFKY